MAKRRRSRFRRRRRHERPSVSMVTYTRVIDQSFTAAASNATGLTAFDIPDVSNDSGETVNRKIVGISGMLMMAAACGQNQHAVAMFAHRAAPELDSWPATSDWDPFNDGPDGSDSYKGRPSPRPFGRRLQVVTVPDTALSASTAQIVQEAHRYHSKSERLLRPGWKLQAGIYVRGSTGVKVRVTGVLRYAVAG